MCVQHDSLHEWGRSVVQIEQRRIQVESYSAEGLISQTWQLSAAFSFALSRRRGALVEATINSILV